jgi:hypothetical protein
MGIISSKSAIMQTVQQPIHKSTFIDQHLALLTRRFSISYRHEFGCIDYYIDDIRSHTRVSEDILFTEDRLKNRIVISRFYPQLYKQTESKYLSAISFYLMVHHFMGINAIPTGCDIYLSAKPAVFQNFYRKLQDFNFQIQGHRTGDYLDVTSPFETATIDTSMITRTVEQA